MNMIGKLRSISNVMKNTQTKKQNVFFGNTQTNKQNLFPVRHKITSALKRSLKDDNNNNNDYSVCGACFSKSVCKNLGYCRDLFPC
jgi:hypothetical protein